MPFDGGMTAAVVWELNTKLTGAKIEKVHMPTSDEIVLLLHTHNGSCRLSLSASAHMPKVGLTSIVKENPATPGAFCMHMRKQLTGCKIKCVTQPNFERVVKISLDGYDEMGFATVKHLYAEMIGKCSNVILTEDSGRIINLIKPVDFSTSSKRQLLPGAPYEMPPSQGKINPLNETESDFITALKNFDGTAENFFMRYTGFSPLIARELAYKASSLGKSCDVTSPKMMYSAFSSLTENIKNGVFTPVLLFQNGRPVDFTFCGIGQYAGEYTVNILDSFGELTDTFFGKRELSERIKQRTQDIFRLLTNAEARLKKKTANQKRELEECKEKEKYRIWGELIKANLYAAVKGANTLEAVNYYEDDCPVIKIPLDCKLTATANSQKYFKKYAKLKNAEAELKKQISISEKELEYIYTVFDSLTKATDEAEIVQIRNELYESGYASKMKAAQMKKIPKTKPMRFITANGYEVLAGKNNTQNDELTHRTAEKSDWFFHVKGAPGSHVIMFSRGEEPDAVDFTQAAEIAAFYSSKRGADNIDVDYTPVKNVKKPAGSKPGFVVYATNYSATVSPTEEKIDLLTVK